MVTKLILTDRRHTSWLFYKCGRQVELNTIKNSPTILNIVVAIKVTRFKVKQSEKKN